MDLRTQPMAMDQLLGLLRLKPKPGTSGASQRVFSRFRDVNIIVYLSSWVITGTAIDASGFEETCSLRVEDEVNEIFLSLGVLRWKMTYPSKEVEVRNDVTNARLSLLIQREAFSDNEPTWFLDRDSALHVIKGL